MSLLDGLMVFVAVLLGVGLWLMWKLRERRNRPMARHARPIVTDSQAYQDTAPLDEAALPRVDAGETDYGPETIVSYMDVPTNTRPQSQFSTSNLSSLFPEDIEPDTGPSTLPPAPTQDGV